MSAFGGTAQYFDLYHPGVPGELVEKVVGAVTESTSPYRLLDLGTGTGKVLERFLPHFADIIAVEPDNEMMALAKRRLVPHMAADTSIHFVTGRAEDVEYPDEYRASLVLMCRSFQFMDQPTLIQKLTTVVESKGLIAICNDKAIWHLDQPWCQIIKGVVEEVVTQEHRNPEEFITPPPPINQDVLITAAFSDIKVFTIPVERTWNIEQIIGYLYAHSFAAKPLFGDYVEQFESAVRQRLEPLAEDGVFKEHNEFNVVLAKRP